MDRLRHTRLDWRRAQAKARADLERRAAEHCSSPIHCPCGCGAHMGCFITEPDLPSGHFSHGARREAERFARCELGLNGLSCTYPEGHASALHSWEVADRLPHYRVVGEGT